MRTRHLKVIGEVLVRIGVLPLPPVVNYGLGVILLQGLPLRIFSLEIGEGSLQVDSVLLLKVADGVPAHLALQLKSRQEVRSVQDLVQIGPKARIVSVRMELRYSINLRQRLILFTRDALWVEAAESSPDVLRAVCDSHSEVVAPHDVIDTWVHVGPAQDHLAQLLPVAAGNSNGNREFLGSLLWYSNLVDSEIGVRANHSASAEVDTLAREVAAEPALLALETLSEGLEWASGAMPSRRNSTGLVVEVGGAVVLKQLPEVLDD